MSLESEYAQLRTGTIAERPVFSPKQVLSPRDLLPGKKYIWHLGVIDWVERQGHRVGEIVDHAREFSVLQFATEGEEQFALIRTLNRGRVYETWVDLIGLGLVPYPDGKWSGSAWVEEASFLALS